jgi:hypothetical protein
MFSLNLSDSFGIGRSPEAGTIREAHATAIEGFQRNRALSQQLSALSPAAQVAVSTKWSEVCEEMFEFLADHFLTDLFNLVSAGTLSPPALTFAAEIVGRTSDGQAVRAILLPLLEHESALVREGAIYGLRDHADDAVVRRIELLASSDPSPAIRQAARDTLEEL